MHKNKKKFSLMAAVVLFATQITNVAFANDISGHWAQKAIGELHQQGVISGYEDNSFKPDDYMTRAEYVSVVNKVMKFTEEKEISFSDVKDGDWYKNAIAVAVAKGYCNGYEDATFRPNAKITRAEASVMLSKALGLTEAVEDFNFSDASEIPNWAKIEINRLVAAKYISGYPDNSFKAQSNISRAEAFTMLHRVVQNNEVIEYLEINRDGEVVKDKEIKGNLVVNKSVGEGHVTIENTKIHSNLIIRGGGKNSVYLKNVEIDGKIIVEKEGVRLQLQEGTAVKDVETNAGCMLSGRNFSGKVENLIIAKNFSSNNSVEVQLPLENIHVKKTASLVVEDNVQKIDVAKEAADSKIVVKKKAKIDTIGVNAKASITGEGAVKTIRLNGVSAEISETIKANAHIVEEKKKDSSLSSGGGGSSSSGGGSSSMKEIKVTKIQVKGEPNFSEDSQEKTFTVEYVPAEAHHEGVEWKLTEGEEYIKIKTSGNDSVTLKAKDNGKYTLQAVLRGKSDVKDTISGEVTGQIVTLEDGSVIGATAGDKKITGIKGQKTYYLKSGTEFYSVKKDGTNEKQNSEEEAVTKSEPLEAAEITGLDNEKSYLLFEVTLDIRSRVLETAVKEFLAKYQGEYAISTKNVDLIEKEYNEINEKFNDFVVENNLGDIWGNYRQELDRFKERIDIEKEARRRAIEEINQSLNKIQEEQKLTLEEAIELSEEIEVLLLGLSDETESELTGFDKYKILKKEVAAAKFPFKLDRDGTLTINPALNEWEENPLLMLQLKKDNQDVGVPFEINLKDRSTFKNPLLEMRNQGVGTYRVTVVYEQNEFRYVAVTPIEVEGTVEIKEIENTLDMIKLKDELTSQQGSHVRFDADTGEITWDEVDNATGYDVWVDLAIASTEGAWGKYYLKPEGEGFQKIQNEFESSELTPVEGSNDKFYKLDSESQKESKRVHVAIGLKEPKINLNALVPVQSNGFAFLNRFKAEEDCKGYIYIIPRNQGSIYITKGYDINNKNNNNKLGSFDAQVDIETKWKNLNKYLSIWEND